MFVKKKIIWNPAICGHKSGKYLGSIVDKSLITYEKIITEKQFPTKIVPTKFS